MNIADIAAALADFRDGEKVLFVGDGVRPREGYLALAAEKATAESIGFMIRHGTGYLGLALGSERMEELGMPQAPFDHSDAPFSKAVEPAAGEGAVPLERQAELIRTLADPATRAGEVELPPCVVPMRAVRGGILLCATPVEAAVDLARLAGLRAVSVVCRLADADADGATPERLGELADRHRLKVVSIPALIAHRRRHAKAGLIRLPAPVRLPTRYGVFLAQVYEDPLTGVHHMALTLGEVDDGRPVLTRLHSECLTGDVLGSLRCDCGPQLHRALGQIAEVGHGALLYLRQEGRGIGLYHKLQTYALQERGLDTVEANEQLGFPADVRDYDLACQMLGDLGIRKIRLLTNNPKKIAGLETSGLEVVERVPLVVSASAENRRYLRAKRKKLGHLLSDDAGGER